MNNRKLYFGRGTGNQHHVVDEETGKTVALTYSDEGGAVAEEIARRWNERQELVDRIAKLEEAMENIHAWATSRDGSGQSDEANLQTIADICSENLNP